MGKLLGEGIILSLYTYQFVWEYIWEKDAFVMKEQDICQVYSHPVNQPDDQSCLGNDKTTLAPSYSTDPLSTQLGSVHGMLHLLAVS